MPKRVTVKDITFDYAVATRVIERLEKENEYLNKENERLSNLLQELINEETYSWKT